MSCQKIGPQSGTIGNHQIQSRFFLLLCCNESDAFLFNYIKRIFECKVFILLWVQIIFVGFNIMIKKRHTLF